MVSHIRIACGRADDVDLSHHESDASTTRLRPQQQRVSANHSDPGRSSLTARKDQYHASPLQAISGNRSGQVVSTQRPVQRGRSGLGKRSQDDTSELSEQENDLVTKRPRFLLPNIADTDQPCDACKSIRWDKIAVWMNDEERIDWRGRMIDDVGKRFRNVSPTTTCPICRQLHAPWIEPFLKRKDPMYWKAKDFGDRIHVFRHLRHLPYVNDYQGSRNELRKYNAPYHIAVIPDGSGWKEDFRAHIAARGMVTIMPKDHIESEIFAPRQVSSSFDRQVVRDCLKFCRHHKALCIPIAPEVKGMRLIDCDSASLRIRDYSPGDKYVALSYVWGRGASNAVVSTWTKPLSTLPKDIPLTVRDAIEVTQALRYRYLWVDKYCINQADQDEMQHQFSRMGDIYGGSQLTIFALGDDADYGLPGVSSRPRAWQKQTTDVGCYEFVSTRPDPHLSIEQSQWATRAWTFQEGLFSTRSLFFTDHQVYYECNAMNQAETFKSSLKALHIMHGRRARAYQRAGKHVCGNSNPYSHLDIKRNKANHRKVDTIRRFQYQIQQYTKKELTNPGDILHAFAGIARFYARTTARIVSLAGIAIPFPIARLGNLQREGLDHLSYALAWKHQTHTFFEPPADVDDPDEPLRLMRKNERWHPQDNPKPQRREGFPSWSWAGWFGELEERKDLPYYWTSLLTSVRIIFQEGEPEEYSWLQTFATYKQYLIRKLLTANELHFDAHVLNPAKLIFWDKNRYTSSGRDSAHDLHVNLSMGAASMDELYQKLQDKELECLVLGTNGEPRKEVFKAIRAADKISLNAKQRRIDSFLRTEPDAIVCLIVRTVNGKSHRRGLLKVEFVGPGGQEALRHWDVGPKRSFILV